MPSTAPRREIAGSAELFRREVVVGQQTQWLGTVLLVPRRSHRLFTITALLVIASIVALLCFGGYTRKAHINGLLVPDLGLIQVVAPQQGTVAKMYVKEGDQVTAEAPLLLLSTEIQSEVIGATRENVVRQLHKRRDSLIAERSRQQQLFVQQSEQGAARLKAITAESDELKHVIELQHARMELARRVQTKLEPLSAQHLVTEQRVQAAEQDNLDQAVQLKSYERDLAGLDQQIAKLRGELQDLPLQQQMQLDDTNRKIAALEQEIAEAEARRQIILTAPQAGIVGAVQATLGAHIAPTVPLVSIVPSGSKLQAQLFSPSRAVGFVRRGQRVLLRYEAFPYQKFGLYEGRVADVSNAALSPSELPQQLAGLTSLYGSTEPVYRITVDLAKQTATAYGKPAPLQPGMRLEADVLIERRTLIEWMFDPLYTLTGGHQQ
jgi:membrane fusion protein